ncbi:AzlD domain-containing protein [Rubeoparvulum massiliense]|uniref:AzlD domain-containing protein n=1 Tax=Rubeoparvulum massiliense TaxID=1631346 RepID=UPI00065E7BC9|nr:AzlD domain-containing protein [Rubeoparvulum massiliense]
MEMSTSFLLLVLGGTMMTAIPRILPLAVLSQFDLPRWMLQWLRHIPIAIMAALLAQELFVPTEEFPSLWGNWRLLAALPALLVALFTRSLMGTVMVGVITLMILRGMF